MLFFQFVTFRTWPCGIVIRSLRRPRAFQAALSLAFWLMVVFVDGLSASFDHALA
jgi:hypothetical protein